MMAWAKVKVAAMALAVVVMVAGGAAVVAMQGPSSGSGPAAQPATDPLAPPDGVLVRPIWPAKGTDQLVQISCIVDSTVVEKLRSIGRPVVHQCTGYEAIKADPEMVLHYLRQAKRADLAYLPDFDWWYRMNLLRVGYTRPWDVFHRAFTDEKWRGEKLPLEIRQSSNAAITPECRLTGGQLQVNMPGIQIELGQSKRTADVKLTTSVSAGDAIVIMGKIGRVGAEEVWHVIVHQIISTTPEELANYREMHDEVAWIENGTAGEQKLVQQAVAWQAKAKASPAKPNARWVRDLPGGTRVEVLAVNSPKLNPYCWWTPDGAAAMPGYRRERVVPPGDRVVAMAWMRVTRPKGFFGSSSQESWFYVRNDGIIQLAEGSGVFKPAATLKPEVGQRVWVEGQPFGIRSLSGSGDSCSVVMEYTFFKDLDTRVVVVTVDGKEHDPYETRLPSGDRTLTDTDWRLGYPVAAAKVKEFRVKTRPLYPVRFEGMALKPTESLPSP